MADHLSDVVLRLVRDRELPSSYSRESPFQALKSSLDDSPPDPSRIAASRRLLLLPPYTPSNRLISPHQAIQQALTLADHRIQACFPRSQAHLFSEVIHHPSLPPHLGFSAKRDLLELLLVASPPPPPSSTLILQADKLFAKIIDDACKKVVASSTSDCLEELVVSAIINDTSDDEMIRATLVQRLLLSTAPRPLERERLDAYKQAFAGAILELAEGYPSAEAAGAALAAAADRWPGGGDHTRDEVKRFVSLGREAIPSMRDRLHEVVKRAIKRVRKGRDNLCPLKDAMNVLSQMPPDSSMAEIIVHRLVFHSKPFPTEQYSSLMRSCMNHLINLYANQRSERSIDVEEFACFFYPDVILMMGMTSQNNHTIEENIGGSSSSQAHGAIRDRLEMNYQAPYPEMEAKIDQVLRDALIDAGERLESSTAVEESSNNDSLEAIIQAMIYAFPAPSLSRDLLRQVLIDSKEPPPESLVDQAFMKIVFSAMDSINRSSGYCRKDIVDYLLDAIEDQIKSSNMKQALVERLVFSCRPPPVELSGGHVLGHSIAAGVWQLAEELSVERPLEAMAGAIRRLPFAGPVVKKILLLIVSNVEEPSKKLPREKKKEEKKKEEEKKKVEEKDYCKMLYGRESEQWPCLGPPTRFMVKQKFKVVKPK